MSDKKPTIILIAAVGPTETQERVIGDGNKLPWHLPRDLRFFRRVTLNHTVVMGRKTFESFGRRPLPKRKNIVISRNPEYSAPGCDVYHSLPEAIQACDEDQIFIIGGGEIYHQAMSIADEIILTEIFDENQNANLFPLFSGTVFFPKINEFEWKLTRPGKMKFLASNKFPLRQKQKLSQRALYFRVLKYKRKHSATSHLM